MRFSLFSELENRGASYGVESAVLGFASLEEVFLNVIRLARRKENPTALGAEGAAGPDGESLESVDGLAGSPGSSQGYAKMPCLSSTPETLAFSERCVRKSSTRRLAFAL